MPRFRVTATQDMPWFAFIDAEDEEQAWAIAKGDIGPDPQWQREEERWESDLTLKDIEEMKE